jgi:very-short-patch-repair endonuclease
MGSPLALLVVLALVAGLLVAVKSLLQSTRPPRPKIDPNWQPPKADRLPYVRRKYFFSAAERSFYEVLRRLLPEQTVFAKVRLADVIRVPKGTDSWQSHHNRIDRKHLDFIICDADLAPIVAVELDDSSHDGDERRERDRFIDQALAATQFPIIHVRAKRGYQLD